MIVSSATLGLGKATAANDRVALAWIGYGGQGSYLRHLFSERPGSEVLAVADVDANHRMEFLKDTGKDLSTYNDYRKILDRKDIDAVVIATPDHWHAAHIIDSAQAGKDVYCEKPLTLTIDEGKECVRAIRNQKTVFQTGSMQRSDERFRRACELVRSGYLGDIVKIETYIGGAPTGGMEPDTDPDPGLDWELWLGQAPLVPYRVSRCHKEFRWWYAYSGGKMTDWGAHHNDIAQWANGTERSGPVSIEGEATFPPPGGYNTATSFKVRMEYENAAPVICMSDGPNGVKFFGTEGELFVSRSEIKSDPPEIIDTEFKPTDTRLYKSDDHYLNFLECIKTREDPICDVEIGHRSVTVCHLANIAIRLGRKIQWDPVKEEIVGDEEAAAWTSRPRRRGYELPKVLSSRVRQPQPMNRRGLFGQIF
ncbi:MAG: Gfo/Idh/MocA family oxidoreductase [Candidatus Omnitrophica bacterium]|nr:Gfo/Idh/MocA family oxidoreductase [Candidatus Omnitrophota bacterium]